MTTFYHLGPLAYAAPMSPTAKKALSIAGSVGLIFGIAGAWMLFKTITAKDVGEACETNECDSLFGEYCVYDDLGGFCAPQCESVSDCPDDWTCEHPTQVDQYGGSRTSSVSFCMRSNVIARGTATVASATGIDLAPGTACNWRQAAVSPESGFDCQWTVQCGSVVLYGGDGGGYNPRTDPSWPAGAQVHDPNTTSNDGDASFVFGADGMRVHDDATGALGAFDVTLTPG